jgi:putative nucleotidyltransferase with HDIG domain
MDAIDALAAAMPATGRIDDAPLRRAVLRTWAASLARAPYADLAVSPQAPHMPARPLLLHVNEVNARALDLIDVARRDYGLRVDSDLALATAILHDVDKPMIYRYDGDAFSYAEGRTLRDHGALGAELCVEHGIPLEIAEMVRHHSAFASQGLPGTVEGTIVHYADWVSNDFAAVLMGVETIHASTRPVPKGKPAG